jgi:hypothetical protein
VEGFGLMIGFIGFFDTALDYIFQFTITHTDRQTDKLQTTVRLAKFEPAITAVQRYKTSRLYLVEFNSSTS